MPMRSPSLLVRVAFAAAPVAALAACTTAKNPPLRPAPNELGPDDGGGGEGDPIWNPQGSDLLAAPRALEPFSVAITGWALRGAPVRAAQLVDGELALAGRTGAALAGATFTATAPDASPVAMRITAAVPHDNPWNGPPSRVRHDYVIEYQDARGDWRSLCPDEYPGAMAIPGSFAINAKDKGPVSNGDYEFSTERFMFSCRQGVAAKCVDWGYPPWERAGTMAAYFQACTRMARADYCGTGHSRTIEGTMINYGDLGDSPVIALAHVRGFVPEAVWGPGSGTRGRSAAICLSRTRWSTMPIGPRSPCAELMPDPRDDGASQRFCDDTTVADWESAGALFVNTSRIIDVGLYQWSDGAGHFTTTTRFEWQGPGVEAHGPPGYPHFVSIEGTAYKPTPRAPAVPGLVPLFRYVHPGRPGRSGEPPRALTTTNPAPGDGFASRELQGYVFAPSAEPPVASAQPLVLHGDGRGGFATTTDPRPPAGYTRIADLGWVPR
jgi:hypothetical protein